MFRGRRRQNVTTPRVSARMRAPIAERFDFVPMQRTASQ